MPHELAMNIDRWLRLMELWGFGRNQATFSALMAAYSEKGRHYHTQEHISACLRHLDRCIASIDSPREVELALWFHDAVYKPLSGGNERKSANWSASFLSENGAPSEAIDRVHRLIMVTEHNAPTKTRNESLLVDIDLSILGADPDTYQIFEKAVRSEYRLVPLCWYKKKRADVLRGFLERTSIFQNEPFITEREHQAKENLANAVSKLAGRA